MKKAKLLCIHTACFLLLFFIHMDAHSQHQNDSTLKYYTDLLKQGKSLKTTGIVFMAVGTGLMVTCALLEGPKKTGSINLPSGGQLITGLGGFIFTTAGIIKFFKGDKKVRKAKIELGTTSYYLMPGVNVDAPSVAIKLSLGR